MDALLRRREMMTGRETPAPIYPYPTVEYLENTGGSFIDTGYYPSNNTDIEMAVMVVASNASSLTRFFETRNAYMDRNYGILNYGDSNNQIQYRFGNDKASGTKLTYGVRHKLSTVGNKLYVDDQLTVTAPSRTFQCNRTLVLWSYVNGSSAPSSGNDERFRLYYCKIYSSGTLTHDFIPVREESVGCLYDKVTMQLFYNGGSNPFVIGPDINTL